MGSTKAAPAGTMTMTPETASLPASRVAVSAPLAMPLAPALSTISASPPYCARRGGQWLLEDDLQAHLAALLRLENVGVMLGAGASMGAPRIVVFDINGEYEEALKPHVDPAQFVKTVLGGPNGTFRIPYYALGRHGLSRLLLPSEKTQRPALAFALENLAYVKWFAKEQACGLADSTAPELFDDGRPGDATGAWNAIDKLRRGVARPAARWPNMAALACLVAESHALKQGRVTNTYERDAFHYSNVAPLVTRIRRCVEDPLFVSVVEVSGGGPKSGSALDWNAEGAALCDRLFGTQGAAWKIHLVELRNVAHDLMPLVLGALLELLAFELFKRGQDQSYPTLLVLEEAHHYLRQFVDGGEEFGRNSLAYERLAKEGRKFGLSLWLSTQRPAEVSSTVLAQCGTWVVFRLASEQDLKAVASAGEWVDRQEISRIAGLPRQQAVVFGAGVTIPARVIAPTADPCPKSSDPDFSRWVTTTNASQSAIAPAGQLVKLR